MPRSARHKSSKHSSRDAREYSDSEKDSSLKDRKSKEESSVVRVSKDLGSSEKRKLDLKDGKDSYGSSRNGDYSEDLVSSKRRKERVNDGGSDRWNGGENDHKGGGEGSNKSLKGESKSKKRDDTVDLYAEGGEVQKSTSSSGKGEGKHRDRDRDRDKDSIRKEGREGGGAEREKEREREKKGKDGRTERLVSNDEQLAKQVNEKTDLNARDELESPESENQIERRRRKRRDFGDGDKHLDDVEDINDGRLSSMDDSVRDVRQKDEKQKDERYREKFREDMDKDIKHRDDKQRDECPTKEHPSSKYGDEKDMTEMQQKRSKLQDGERKGEHDRDRDRNRDRDSYHARDRDRYHDREREYGWDHGREGDRDRDCDRDWDWDRERDGDRERDRSHDRDRDRDRGRDHDKDGDRDRDRDRDYDRDYDGSHFDDRSMRYKESSRGKKRSPDDRDDCSDTKSRGMKARYSDLEKKSSSGDRVESDVNKGRSQSRQAYIDTIMSSNKWRTSPSSNSHAGIDEYRYLNPEDLKFRDSVGDQRSKAIPPRDDSGVAGGSKYRSMEKPIKMDDGHLGELSNEMSSSAKASPLPLMERSPSSSNIDRRYMNRTGVRWSLDIEETGRRSSASIDNRDFSNTEDRVSRDLPSEKPLVDESFPADSSAHNRSRQSNLSLFPSHPNFRAGVDSTSFVGSLEEDNRINSNARYRRSSDPNLVRGHGNGWRGVPSWTSPVPNGFMHFQHGAPHGGFQGMLPQYPAPPIFGVRPMEINHSGIPYHIPDADRFSGHLRPLGWQHMMDGSGPSHLHLWDGNNGAFRDETNMYGGAEWDQHRHPMNARGWESSGETWKVQNSDVKRDLPSPAQKDEYPMQALVDDSVAGQAGQMSHHEDNVDVGVHPNTFETKSFVTTPVKQSISKLSHEKSPGHSKSKNNEVHCVSHYYLSKLDISAELAHPELYSQCMSILDTEGSATVDEDVTAHTILEGARTGLGSSKTLLSSSLFPPLKASVFQKAMNLYKKQRMETRGFPFVAGGRLDIILASSEEIMEEKVRCDVEKEEETVRTMDAEMTDAPVSSLDEKNFGSASNDSAEEKLEVLISHTSHEVQNRICLASAKLEMPVEDYSGSNSGEPQTILNGAEMESSAQQVKLEVGNANGFLNGVEMESSEQVKLEVEDANGFSSLDNASLATSTLPAAGNDLNVISKTKDDNFTHHANEGAADAVFGPLTIPEGSPKACDALMSGSNESDSVILSRIHHSPESTH